MRRDRDGGNALLPDPGSRATAFEFKDLILVDAGAINEPNTVYVKCSSLGALLT